jgi:hypothetical protein
MSKRVTLSVLTAATLAAGSCSDPLGPEELPCAVPASLITQVAAQPADNAAIRAALLHAAGPMASALGSPELTATLGETTELVAQALDDGLPLTGCRILARASESLDRLSDDPATLPDREGIRLILAIAAHRLSESQTR